MIVKPVLAGALALVLSVSEQPEVATLEIQPAASDWFMAYHVPQPPEEQRGTAVGGPVFFTDQAGIDALCGGNNHVIACAVVGGTAMALPNPCQPRFAGEAYAALVCHEKGHLLGWKHKE